MADPTFWFTLEVGAFVRGACKRAVMQGAWDLGLEVQVDESRGLLESVYRFRVTGAQSQLLEFRAALERWEREMEFVDA